MTSGKNGTPPPPPHLFRRLHSLWRRRYLIIYFTSASTLFAVIISLLLPNYFTASTTFLTISPDQNSIGGVFGKQDGGYVEFYGTGNDIERIMSVAESDDLVDFMVDKFNLYKVYNIDSTKRKGPVRVRREFLGLYSVIKTPRDAIELKMSDQDPPRAAAMAQAACQKINEISLNLIRNTQQRIIDGLRSEVKNREKNLADINLRLGQIRKISGVYNTSVQSEVLATRTNSMQESLVSISARLDAYRHRGGKGSLDSIAKLEIQLAGMKSARIDLDSQLVRLNKSVGPIDNLEEERRELNGALSKDRVRLKQLEAVIRSDQRSIEVLEEAKVPFVKSSPIRGMIIALAFFFSFIAAILVILVFDSGSRHKWKSVFND